MTEEFSKIFWKGKKRMIGTMTDEQVVADINRYEGPQLLALFMALYSLRQNGKKVTEKHYEAINAKVVERLNQGAKVAA